jgi:hypothetical protein
MIIGQPKRIEEFQPLTPEEFAYLRQPLDQAIAQGVPLNQPAAVDLGILCRLLATVVLLSTEMKKMRDVVAEQEAKQPEPFIASMLGEPLPVEPETTLEEIAKPETGNASAPLPSLNLDPSRRVVLGDE